MYSKSIAFVSCPKSTDPDNFTHSYFSYPTYTQTDLTDRIIPSVVWNDRDH